MHRAAEIGLVLGFVPPALLAASLAHLTAGGEPSSSAGVHPPADGDQNTWHSSYTCVDPLAPSSPPLEPSKAFTLTPPVSGDETGRPGNLKKTGIRDTGRKKNREEDQAVSNRQNRRRIRSALTTPKQLDAIERKYQTKEVKALVAEIRRLNAIAWRAQDVLNQFDAMPTMRDSLPDTLKAMLAGLWEQLETPATGGQKPPRQGPRT